jgi:hypothetical protein
MFDRITIQNCSNRPNHFEGPMITKILAGIAACLSLTAATGAYAASDSAGVKKTIVTAFAKANKGDMAGAFANFAKDGTVIDEFAPFHWSNFDEWGKALDSYNTQSGVARASTRILKFVHVNAEGGRAYAVLSVLYSYKISGKLKKEPATEVMTLARDGTAWKIDAFNFLGKAGADAGADSDAIVAAANGFARTASASPAPTAIVDEFAPYHWVGTSAQDDWGGALKAMMTKTGGSDLALKLDPPSQLSVNGTTAYAVFPTTITSKTNGKPEVEKGAFAMAFAKDGGWHIVSWAWATK